MAASKLAVGAESSKSNGDSPILVELRDGGALRRHTLNWLSQLASRRSVYPLSPPGITRSLYMHGTAWHVFWNKLRVFQWFAKVESRRGGNLRNLAENLLRVSNDPTFTNLWRTEGLGYYAGMTALRRKVRMSGLLNRDICVPGNCLVPFHLGVGMAFSISALQATRDANNSQLHDALVGLYEMCRDNAVRGLARVVFEPLGFVAANYYKPLIPRIDESLSQIDLELSDYFWHGIGRGLYFRPDSFLPYRNLGWQALDRARRLAPNEQKRAGCLAGVSFAATLVNIRHPRHLDFVLAARENESDEADALASGVQAAMVVWYCWSVTRKHIDAFAELKPHPDVVATDQWRRLVSEPCRLAVMEEYPRIVRFGGFENLFRYGKDLLN